MHRPTITAALATAVATLTHPLLLATTTDAFLPMATVHRHRHRPGTVGDGAAQRLPTTTTTTDQTHALSMAAGGGNKKKRRRRKKPDASSTAPAADAVPPASTGVGVPDGALPAPPVARAADGTVPPMGGVVDKEAYLPDIRNVLKKKEQKKQEKENEELQKTPTRKRISRGDKAAFLQLLEAEPFADADDSFFVEEEYGTVSALLGEGALDFLGIPPGPLQIGHFIGALGIVLCAFVEYPGFPLTNLPTPLRGSLQGGLATIYTINAVLAGIAYSKAGERGQSGVLWAAKTFSVGGLAYDQLTQLPTLEEAKQQGIKR